MVRAEVTSRRRTAEEYEGLGRKTRRLALLECDVRVTYSRANSPSSHHPGVWGHFRQPCCHDERVATTTGSTAGFILVGTVFVVYGLTSLILGTTTFGTG